jgi:hypothetical protein
MHSPEPMVVLHTRFASEGIPPETVYTTHPSPTTSAEQYGTRQKEIPGRGTDVQEPKQYQWFKFLLRHPVDADFFGP